MFEQIHNSSGPLDVLVNNVGLYLCGDLLDYKESDFEQTIQTNLMGAYYCIQSAPTQMKSGGNIINIGYSGLSSLAAQPDSAAYLISKLTALAHQILCGRPRPQRNLLQHGLARTTQQQRRPARGL